MGVTSKDIARQLQISQSTVSRALRDDPRVAAETKARVLEAAERLNYTPNLAAASLVTRSTRTVGLVVSDITNPFYPQLVDILHDELVLARYRTILINERTNASIHQHVAELVNGGAIDGLINLSATIGTPLIGKTAARRLPVVLLNRSVDGVEVDTVTSDNRTGGRLLAHALVEHGHRDIAIITGPQNTSTSRDRESGFREGLESLGVPLDDRLRRVGQFSHESGYHWCLDLLGRRPRPTAIFAANDVIAFGVLDAARRRGVVVPDDLTVVGFDDIAMASWEGFSLTTMRQPMTEMARHAASLLIERIAMAEDVPARRRVFPVELVRRETLGPAPAEYSGSRAPAASTVEE